MEKEMISVVIPTYNREKSILASINSVLNQTYKNIEVIVVDDGSKDKTEELIKTINDARLKYIKLDGNHGACYARNVGIKESTGKYIAFQDSDDTYRENKLEIQLKNLKEHKSDFDFHKMLSHINNQENVFPDIKINKDRESVVNKLCEQNIISTQTMLIKKELLLNNMFDETLPRLQDYDLALRVVPISKISFTNEVLSDVYRNDDNISNNDNKLKKAALIMIKKEYPLDEKQHDELYKTLARMLLVEEYNQKDNDFIKLYNEYKKLSKEYEKIEKDYRSIINSKRWKLINKIIKNRT